MNSEKLPPSSLEDAYKAMLQRHQTAGLSPHPCHVPGSPALSTPVLRARQPESLHTHDRCQAASSLHTRAECQAARDAPHPCSVPGSLALSTLVLCARQPESLHTRAMCQSASSLHTCATCQAAQLSPCPCPMPGSQALSTLVPCARHADRDRLTLPNGSSCGGTAVSGAPGQTRSWTQGGGRQPGSRSPALIPTATTQGTLKAVWR